MKTVKIHTEYITLGQFLKHVNLVSSGGEVKHFLRNNQVLIDDQNDDRRGRKIYPNNVVTVLNQQYLILSNEN